MDEATVLKRVRQITNEFYETNATFVSTGDVALYRAAYADGQRDGMERAAKIACGWCSQGNPVLLTWDGAEGFWHDRGKEGHWPCKAWKIRQAAGEVQS